MCQPDRRRRFEMAGRWDVVSAVAVFWIVVAAVCCGLCIYGISRSIRRSKERQTEDQSVPTH
jgi:hypothetical protein